MPRNVYAEIHLHVTWHTKRNDAVIVDDVKQRLYQYLSRRIAEAEEVSLRAIGGVPDHVHLAVTVPPTLHVSEWIGQLKGASAHYINHRIVNRKLLEWQAGYEGGEFRHERPAVGRGLYSQPKAAPRTRGNTRPAGTGRANRGSPLKRAKPAFPNHIEPAVERPA